MGGADAHLSELAPAGATIELERWGASAGCAFDPSLPALADRAPGAGRGLRPRVRRGPERRRDPAGVGAAPPRRADDPVRRRDGGRQHPRAERAADALATTRSASARAVLLFRELASPQAVTRAVRRSAVLYALVIVAAFPTVAAMRRTFAPNGAVAGQMSQPTDAGLPVPRADADDHRRGRVLVVLRADDGDRHRSLGDGTVPLWNPYAGLGMPLIANAQSAVGSPLTRRCWWCRASGCGTP